MRGIREEIRGGEPRRERRIYLFGTTERRGRDSVMSISERSLRAWASRVRTYWIPISERRAGEKTERKVGRKRMPGDPVWAGDVKMETSSIEVVRETEEGVYEIDLGRMMDSMLNKLPVVMMEKGVYLINLGSDRRDTP